MRDGALGLECMPADRCLFSPFQISSLKELTGAYDGSSDSFLPVSERLRGQKGSRGEPGERGPPGREVSTVVLQGGHFSAQTHCHLPPAHLVLRPEPC